MRRLTGVRQITGLALFTSLSFSAPALAAADLPPVKASDDNPVAACATPGRLMSFVKARNPDLDAKFDTIATEYMRHGQELGLRWDVGFYQMLLETGFLRFKGDVKPDQNNFAGLGTTGGGVRGEKFKDVSTGARAHLEHLAMYSGERIESPVAERTRNIQDWAVLTKWQKTIKGPMTFSQLAKQWAPGSRGYASDMRNVMDRFMNGPCKEEDPNPGLLASADSAIAKTAAPVEAAAAEEAHKMTIGDQLAKRANDEARAEGGPKRVALGATSLLAPAAVAAAAPAPNVKILNAAEPAISTVEPPPVDTAPTVQAGEAKVETAALSSIGKVGAMPEPEAKDQKAEKPAVANQKCRVFTASYGGEKAVIVKAIVDKVTNYTVLHVNDGTEKREAEAYIEAYAKGGETVGSEFKDQDQALDKAFEMCPEG